MLRRLSIEELFRQELEFYSHKLVEGDITPILFELLKDTKDMQELLTYLGYKPVVEEKTKNEEVMGAFSKLFENSTEVS